MAFAHLPIGAVAHNGSIMLNIACTKPTPKQYVCSPRTPNYADFYGTWIEK